MVFLQWLSKFLLLPLIQKAFTLLWQYTIGLIETKELKKENDDKVKKYEENKSPTTAIDDFSKLP